MPIDGKYGRVTLERGSVGDDEPVVVFRARDIVLPHVLTWYRDACELRGSPPEHLRAIDDAIERISEWQTCNDTQVPQSAGYRRDA